MIAVAGHYRAKRGGLAIFFEMCKARVNEANKQLRRPVKMAQMASLKSHVAPSYSQLR